VGCASTGISPKKEDNMNTHEADSYGPGYGDFALNLMRFRNAERSASFLLPHLRAGMTLLDCGCGPGTITIGLADAVAPGEVVGIDIETHQFSTAMEYTKKTGLSNIRFQTGDISDLQFADESFDIVFTNAVLMYLSNPASAVREIFRVLKPGGVLGARDVINDRFIVNPEDQLLEEHRLLMRRAIQRSGGDADIGRKLGSLLHEVGFQRLHLSVSAELGESPEDKREYCHLQADIIERSGVAELCIEEGRTDRERLAQIGAACRALGERPDGFVALIFGEALGWKP